VLCKDEWCDSCACKNKKKEIVHFFFMKWIVDQCQKIQARICRQLGQAVCNFVLSYEFQFVDGSDSQLVINVRPPFENFVLGHVRLDVNGLKKVCFSAITSPKKPDTPLSVPPMPFCFLLLVLEDP
jgi:hypothetical protein